MRLSMVGKYASSCFGRSAFGLCWTFLLFGCQASVQDSAKPQQTFRIVGPTEGCLESSASIVSKYFRGLATAEEVDKAWDCASGAIDMFTTYTQGVESKTYGADELRSFMERYFLGNLRISDGLLVELMRLKQNILGGSLNEITRDELARTKFIFSEAKRETLRLLPHIPLLTLRLNESDVENNPIQLESALADFSLAMENIGQLLGQSKSPYQLNHIENLLKHLESFYVFTSSDSSIPNWIIERLPTVAALKAFIIRPNGKAIAPNEWQELVSSVTRLYSMYLRVHYLLSNRDKLSGNGLDQLTMTISELFNLLQFSVNAKEDGAIGYKSIDDLIDELWRVKIIEWDIKTDTIKSLARTVLEKVFNPVRFDETSKKPYRLPLNGLTSSNLELFRQFIMGWLDMQRLWRQLVKTAETDHPELVGKGIPLPIVREIWPGLISPYQDAFNDMSVVWNRKVPISYHDDGSVVFESDPNLHVIDQAGFDSLNWKQAFARVVSLGFAVEGHEDAYKGVTKNEFRSFYDDFRQLAIELEFLDPNDDSMWESMFFESNLFMLSGDMNEWLSFSEGLDLISYAMSVAAINRPLRQDLLDHCEHQRPDVFGDPTFFPSCVRERMAIIFSAIYSRLPGWVSMFESMGPEEKDAFQKILESAGRTSGYSDQLMETSDLTHLTMVIQYVESIFVRFDKNKSGSITIGEASKMFPLLEGVLSQASGLKKKKSVFALFTYMLRYGHPPQTSMQKIYFKLIWENMPSKWNSIWADRLQMLRIVSSLKASI